MKSLTASPACSSAPTTTSSSRSRPPSWSHGSGRCCAATTPPRRRRPAVKVGDLIIDPESREATRAGEPLLLTQRELDLLLFLALHPGKAFTREQLMDHVWRFSYYTDTSTVTVHIRRLRAKIERDPDQPKYIETVWGVGYRFAAG